MNSAYGVLLALAAVIHATIAAPQYYGASHQVNIATVVFASDTQNQVTSSSALDGEFVDRLDLILVGNDSISKTWLDNVAGFASAADSKVLYQTAGWSLIESGRQQDKLLSSWARFQSVNSAVKSMSVCTMVVDWNDSWTENKAALSAVEVEERVTDTCGVNDTVAVAFTSAVSKTVSSYFEGEIAVNGSVASFKMHDVHSLHFPAASDRLFIRVPDGMCPQDEFVKGLFAAKDGNPLSFSLFEGDACVYNDGVKKQQPPKAPVNTNTNSGSHSHWHPDLRFVIPISFCVFVLGSAVLICLLRRNKDSATNGIETPKEEEKVDPTSSRSYVLTGRPV